MLIWLLLLRQVIGLEKAYAPRSGICFSYATMLKEEEQAVAAAVEGV